MIQHPAEHLTSNYRTDEDSNNYKILDLGHQQHLEILENMERVELSRDIDDAAGFTLDKAGKNVLELRQNRDDEAFRRAIKIKIRGNLSNGTIEDINAICDILFGDHFLYVLETWDKEQYDNEPAAILLAVSDDPDARQLIFEYIRELVMSVKAGGVRLYSKIVTNIPPDEVFIGAVADTDYTSVQIPSATLENKTVRGAVTAKLFVSKDVSSLLMPAKEIQNREVSGALSLASVMSDRTAFLRIPSIYLKNRTISGALHMSGIPTGFTGYMRIPTAGYEGG